MAHAEAIKIFNVQPQENPLNLNNFVRVAQGIVLEVAYSMADHLSQPVIMHLGGIGMDGVAPRVRINDRTDLRRLGPDLAGERPMVEEWVRVIKSLPSDACVVDIGAGAGAYTLAAASLLPRGMVVAIEPDPQTFERLCDNAKLNRLDRRIMTMPIALGGCRHSVTLYTDGANGPAPSLRDGKFQGSVTVPMYSLDYLVDRGIIPAPDGVKIDVEGACVGPDGVFAGMSNTLDRGYPRHIFLETHLTAMVGEFGGTTEEVLTMLLDRGYREAFRLDDPRKGPPLYHFVCEAPM